MLEFKARERVQQKIRVTFPDSSVKDFNVISLSVGSQRELAKFYGKYKSKGELDEKKTEAMIQEAIEILFPGHTIADFEGLGIDDLLDLISMVQSSLINKPKEETEEEKKTESE